MSHLRFLLPCLVLLFACGGSSVRVVARDGTHGQIALSGSQESMHEAADSFLRKECQGAYTLLDEGPTAAGEWRISYRCETDVATPGTEAKLETRTLRF